MNSSFTCPTCGKWSEVKDSRVVNSKGEKLPYRRRLYECGNLHRFTNYEINGADLHETELATKFKLKLKLYNRGRAYESES